MAIRAKRNWASRLTLGLVSLVLLAGMLTGLGGAQPARAAQASFSNPASVAIPGSGTFGPASLYPSPIVVSGLTGPVSKVTVDLKGLNHTWTADIAMLLVGPGGQQFVLWAAAAGSGDLINVNVTLDDAAGAPLPSHTTDTAAGTYQPASYTHAALPSPAPALSGNPAAAPDGTATFASVFNGINPNGTWNLFIQDASTGDAGSMTGGWTLNITTTPPAQLTGALKTAVLTSGALLGLPNKLATYLKSAESYLALGTPTMNAAACQQLKQFKAAVTVAMRQDSVVLGQGPTWISQADAIRASIPCIAPN